MKKEKVEALLEEVKKEKRPSAAENVAVARIASEFTGKLDKALRAARAKAKSVVGGSGAKGTWLRGMHDLDVFACFDYAKYKEKSYGLSEFLAVAVKKAFPKHERLHGSRDYFKVRFGGYNFEIVPILCIKTARQALNITDASLLHAGWVMGKTRKSPKLADEIRLAKAFAKAQRVYGAESHIRGFSGYACEVLTIYYGSFFKLMVAAARWNKQVAAGRKIVVDAARHYRGRDPTAELNAAKVQSELIVIDPIQKDRNATAALGNEALLKFISAAESFLKNPSKAAFEKEKITVDSLVEKAQGKSLMLVDAVPHRGKEDVVGAKLLKAHEHIAKQLKENGFVLTSSGWEWEKGRNALFWYVLDKKEPEAEVRPGPPLNNEVHAARFREEHSGKAGRQVFEREGRLFARIERKHKQPQLLISMMIREDAYLREKALSYEVKKAR